MADYNISANITANTRGYEAGINKVQKTTKTFSSSLSKVIQGLGKNGLVGAMGSIGLASVGLTATLGAVVKVVKQVAQTVSECTEAYRKQAIAEKQLSVAVKNNPLLSTESARALRNYASELQSITNYGDEELIPMMANLVSLGRTESETMDIMRVATDYAVGANISLSTAITQLNATLNGNLGRLGLQNAELKTLTEEELKAGKAVEILGNKYKGMAESSANTSKQLKNAIGDFKELLGATFNDAVKPMEQFFTKLITNINNAKRAQLDYKQALKNTFDETGNIKETADLESLQIVWERNKEELAEMRQRLRELKADTSDMSFLAQDSINTLTEEIAKLQGETNKLQSRIQKLKEQEKKENATAQAEQEQAELENKAINLKAEYLKKIDEQERKWRNIKTITGEEVSDEEKIKFYEDSLVDLLTEANGVITTNNQLYKDQIKIIEKLREGLQPEEKETDNTWEKKLREQMIASLEADKEEKLAEVENEKNANILKEKLTVDYNERIKQLKLEALAVEEQEAIKSVGDIANAEEEKKRIREYYENKRLDLIISYAKENKKAGEISAQSFADGFKSVIKKLQPIMKEIGKVLNRIGNIAKSMFQGGVSIFSKLFNIDINTVLDAMLKIEDKILSFFVETLPRLPQFVASVMQSISVLLESVLQVVTPEKISEIIVSILQTITQYAPTIIGAIGNIITNMLDGIINSLPQIIDTLNVVVEKLAEVLPQLIQKLIDLFIGILQNPEKVAQLVVTIIKGIVEIFNVLLRNIGPLLEALLPAIGTIIIELIKAIPDILVSMGSALWEAVKGIGKFIVNTLIDVLNTMLDGISAAWTWIPGTKGIPHIPKLATGTDNAQRGIALVGEAGPELVRFNGGEQVLNNRNTQKALAGVGNSGNTFNVTFNNTMDTTAYAMMSQFKQYNRELAINGVI